MRAEWDDAHTNYASPARPPGPASLHETPTEWASLLEQDTANGWLLRGNSMLQTLASGRPIHLMHTTPALEAIRASRQVYAAAGCLVGSLYCAPLSPEPEGLRPHNMGAYLLETKQNRDVLVIEIRPDAPVPVKGIDYLRLGRIHLLTYEEHRDVLTGAEDARLRKAAVERVRAASGFLDVLLATACGRPLSREVAFVDQLADTVSLVPFLGYLYFEVLSEYLMLHSTSPQTKTYAEAGELNNRLYKQLAFAAVKSMNRLFDLALFAPDRDRLTALVGEIEPSLASGAAHYVERRLSHLFAFAALDPSQDAAAVSFHGADFLTLAQVAPSLLGQMVFRQMRTEPRYPQLFSVFEQAKALGAYGYWNRQGIPTPFNGFLPKGEIGVNLAYPRGSYAVWTAEICDRGLLHPVEQLDVTFIPRLTDLRATALGKAAFRTTTATAAH
ncbi:hypothetical protein [Streptomyces sp. V3I7]|uniref:hypothetical protein n=1 Tax=Streptomyces sp. V3I7 TaxID=3042278 RepID=UPI00278A86E4|nr:hypothetical protein [Streptomyces sp. V3I7]MDQ0990724.1 hypothetical protein [Streptomyces sp. V3I7]